MDIKNMVKSILFYFIWAFALFSTSCGPLSGEKKVLDKNEPWKRPENLFILNPRLMAFVIIDMQNFSCSREAGSNMPGIGGVVANINRLAYSCREMKIPVIWVCHNITSDGTHNDAGLFSLFHSPQHLERTMNLGKGTELYPEMHCDSSRDYIVFKNRYSAFLSDPPELREKIDSLKKTQLVVAGVAANVCVESTVRDAMQLGYEVVLVSDGVAAANDSFLKSTLMNTRLFFGDVRTTDKIIDALHNVRAQKEESLR